MHCTYKPQGVCSRKITFDINDGVVSNVSFTGGCDGNLKAISRVVEGQTAEQISKWFNGIHCGFKNTSCSDQFAHAVMQAAEKEKEQKKK